MEFKNLALARKGLHRREFQELHRKAVQVSEDLKSKEVELIKILQEVESNMVHRYAGYNSLFNYAHKALRLSKAQAYMYCSLAKKSKDCVALSHALESKELSPSKASRLLSVINSENEEHWVGLAVNMSKRELEKEIAKANPRALRPETAKYIDGQLLEVQVCLAEEIYDKLKRVQDLLCQSQRKAVSVEEALGEMTKFYLEKKDPLLKAGRNIKRQDSLLKATRNIKRQDSLLKATRNIKRQDSLLKATRNIKRQDPLLKATRNINKQDHHLRTQCNIEEKGLTLRSVQEIKKRNVSTWEGQGEKSFCPGKKGAEQKSLNKNTGVSTVNKYSETSAEEIPFNSQNSFKEVAMPNKDSQISFEERDLLSAKAVFNQKVKGEGSPSTLN